MTLTLPIVARSSQPDFTFHNATPKNTISTPSARGYPYNPSVPIFYYSSIDDAQRRHLGLDEAGTLSHRAVKRATQYRTRTCPLFAPLYGGRRA